MQVLTIAVHKEFVDDFTSWFAKNGITYSGPSGGTGDMVYLTYMPSRKEQKEQCKKFIEQQFIKCRI